jgi:hypothetical protein
VRANMYDSCGHLRRSWSRQQQHGGDGDARVLGDDAAGDRDGRQTTNVGWIEVGGDVRACVIVVMQWQW